MKTRIGGILTNDDYKIYSYPVNKLGPFSGDSAYDETIDNLAIGDLHGNAIKAIHILIQNGIADINAETLDEKKRLYEELVQAYIPPGKHSGDILPADCLRFQELIKKYLKFNTNNPYIIFIGDMVSDRGKNDLCIWDLLDLMAENNVKFEVDASNHDSGMLNAYYKHLERQKKNPVADIFFECIQEEVMVVPCTSLQQMCKFIKSQGIIKGMEIQKRMLKTFQKVYLANSKFISYEYDATTHTITLSTHAAFGLKSISLLANELGVSLKLDQLTVSSVMLAIDEINAKMNDVLDNGDIYKFSKMSEKKALLSPLYRIMWDRVSDKKVEYDPNDFMPELHGIKFNYRHGHDQPKKLAPAHISMLDNMRGKSSARTIDDDMFNLTAEQFEKKYGIPLTNIESDYSLTRGVNILFYQKLKNDLQALNSLVNPQGVQGELSKASVSNEQIQRIINEIDKRMKMLPMEQQNEYNEQLNKIMASKMNLAVEQLQYAKEINSIQTNSITVTTTTTEMRQQIDFTTLSLSSSSSLVSHSVRHGYDSGSECIYLLQRADEDASESDNDDASQNDNEADHEDKPNYLAVFTTRLTEFINTSQTLSPKQTFALWVLVADIDKNMDENKTFSELYNDWKKNVDCKDNASRLNNFQVISDKGNVNNGVFAYIPSPLVSVLSFLSNSSSQTAGSSETKTVMFLEGLLAEERKIMGFKSFSANKKAT